MSAGEKRPVPFPPDADDAGDLLEGGASTRRRVEADGEQIQGAREPDGQEVPIRVRVLYTSKTISEVVVRVRPDKVDLSAYDNLVELPEDFRRLSAMQELVVKSTKLERLPSWMEELSHLESLTVVGKSMVYMSPMRELPVTLTSDSTLHSLQKTNMQRQ